jgi:hypothetical protein
MSVCLSRYAVRADQLWRCLLRWLLAGVFLFACVGESHAQRAPETDWSIGWLAAKAVNADLVTMPEKALRGDLDMVPSYLNGLVVRRRLDGPTGLIQWAQSHGMQMNFQLELDWLRAHGETHNTDWVLAWRPSLAPWPDSAVSVEFAWSLGVSHSVGKPWSDYTDPDRPQGYRTLLHMGPEIALHPHAIPNLGLALRVQHRSGMYGLIAPRRVGSNHLALLATWDF